MNPQLLRGRRVLIGRSRRQSDSLSAALTALGAEVCAVPLIEIMPPDDWRLVDAALLQLDQYDWLAFTSANAVEFFMQRLREMEIDAVNMPVAAVGNATAAAAREHGLGVEVVAERSVAEGLVDAIRATVDVKGLRILWPRGNLGRETLCEQLEPAGARVTQIIVYQNVASGADASELRKEILSRRIDWILLTSPSMVRNVYALLGDVVESPAWLAVKLATIGPVTTRALRALGREPTVESEAQSAEALANAVGNYESQHGGR